MRKSFYVYLIFLCLGIGIGLFIRFEEWTAGQLAKLLDDEIRDGTGGCHLRKDQFNLSLLRLHAVGKNVDIVCPNDNKNTVALHFDEITVDASLRKIFSLVVTLDDVRLKNGYAQGVSPKYATYKFIDYLAKPASPERQKQTRVRIELGSLLVENSRLFETLGKNLLVAEGVSLGVTYNQNRDVLLTPKVEKLTYLLRGKSNGEIPLGAADGDVQITDTETQLHRIDINRANNALKFSGKEEKHAPKSLTGQSSLSIALSYLGLPNWLTARIEGNAAISGELGSPILSGNFNIPADEQAIVSPGGMPIVTFNSLSSTFVVDVNDGDPIVTLPDLKGESSGSSLSTVTPLQIKNGNLTGMFSLSAKNVSVGPVQFNDIKTTISLSGLMDENTVDFKGSVDTVETLGTMIRTIDFSARSQNNEFLVTADHRAGKNGKVHLNATIDVSKETEITSGIFSVEKYPALALYQPTITPEESAILEVSGTGTVTGPFDPARLNLAMKGSVTSTVVPLSKSSSFDLHISDGLLALTQVDSSQVFTSTLNLGLTEEDNSGALTAQINGKNVLPTSAFSCSQMGGSLQYEFIRGDLFGGRGAMNLNELILGCDRYAIQTAAPAVISISHGSFDLSTIVLRALDNNIYLTGTVNPFGPLQAGIKGKIPLQTLERVLPNIDELSGITDLNLILQGTVKNPVVSGKMRLQDGLIAFERSELLLENVQGDLVFEGDGLEFENLRGKLNGGEVAIRGKAYPFRPADSTITMELRGAAFSPTNGLSFLSDANLTLVTKDQKPLIGGDITITSADFEKKLDIVTLAREVTRLLFDSEHPLVAVGSAPDIPLDITVRANRNIFAVTNFFGAELKADLRIQGSLAKPDVVGSIESLAGWFGLRERRFDMTSGSVQFLGGEKTPQLNVTGESLVRSNAGDILTVYLEANGKVTSPKITFSSDTGLPQQDILTLLTSSGQTMQQTAVNTVGRDVQVGGVSLLEGVPLLSYSKFLRYLSQVDSISIEPQFNVQTGLIEPTVSATKKLSNSVYLLGQGYLGSQFTETRLGAVYNLLPFVNVAALFISATYQENVALELNSTITVLAQQKKFANVSVQGNEIFGSAEILKSVRLGDASRVPPEEMERIRQGIRRFYRQRGYFDARIISRCRTDGEYCRDIQLHITEGELSTIRSLQFIDPEGTGSPIPSELIPQSNESTEALTAPLVDAREDMLTWLRREGFISARVEALYEKTDQTLKRDMVYKITRGRPVTFYFSGNETFSAEDFLETINLFKRKVPFGNNTVNILKENIEQLYKESGFLDVIIDSHSFEAPENGRISHSIKIIEGTQYTLARAELVGVDSPDTETLNSWITKEGRAFAQSIFYPKTYLEELLALRARDVQAILTKQGYNNADVHVTFQKDTAKKIVTPLYQVIFGERSPNVAVEVTSIAGIEVPLPKKPSLYPVQLAQYREDLIKALYDQGYRTPHLTEHRDAPNLLLVSVEPGPVIATGEIEITGSQDIPEQTIRALLNIAPGEPIKTQEIHHLKQRLLNMGLFSRVDINEVPSSDPKVQNLEIKVVEKPLRTLDLGGGYNTELGVHVFAEGSDRSLFKDGRSLTLRLDAYVNNTSADSDLINRGVAALKYTDPSLLETKYILTEDLRYQKLNAPTQEFDLDRTSLTSNIYRTWDSGINWSLGHTILSETLNRVEPDVDIGSFDHGTVRLSYISSSLTLDKRDNPLNPSNGYRATLDGKIADTSIGSEASYYETGLRLSNTLPFSFGDNNFAFAQSLRGGLAGSLRDDDFVPISQRFYLGGRNSVRGYQENSLGPRGNQGNTIGGESLLAGSMEMQYRPIENLSLNAFLDAGNVFLNSFDSKKYNVPTNIAEEDNAFLQYSTGLGMRFLSPIGPIGLDVGFPINGREDDAPWRVHFNIGTNF